MKKNLLVRLCLMTIALLSLPSCRQDLLPEKDTYNNTSAFQLTSKRISLDESKHKGKLISKLEQVENKLKAFSHTDALGKIVNYGNGVSIDTESVIYIENGPNYHTYTFHITKANAPANAPVENLVLTPLPDGTYKELLVTYNLTPAEKLQAENGVAINTHGKAQITELAKGTFNNGNLQGKTITGVTCGWTEEVQFTVCDGNDHHSNGEATEAMGGPCKADNPSVPIMVAVYKCNWIYGTDPFSSSGPGATVEQPPGAPGGGGGPISGTCPDNGVLITPIDPTSGTNMECESGVPTQITVPVRNTPCNKTKAMLLRPNVQQGITGIKAQALQTISNVNAGEIGFKEKKDGTVVPADVNSSHKVVFNDVTDSNGGYHNHTATGTHMFSPPDIDALLGFAAAQSIQDGVGNAYLGMIAGEWCNCPPDNVQYIHYVIRYTGAAADLGTGGNHDYTPAQMKQFEKDYQKKVDKLSNTSLNGNTYIKNAAGDLNEKGLEKLFFETLNNMNLNGKVNLQRIENGTVNNVTLDNNGMPTGTPCPN